MAENLMSLSCPNCRMGLKWGDDSIQCAGCGAKWPVVKGVPNFVSSSEYWGEVGLTREVMRQIVKEMEVRNWRQVIQNHPSQDVRRYGGWLTDFNRARWHELLGIKPESDVLDLGAGLGTMSQALAGHYTRVFAVEKVEERVEFMRLRFAQEGCGNITLMRTDIDLLPFSERSLDLIVLNGVLEWLPYNRKRVNPRRAQLHYLEALRKLLRPGGTLYVGIENRLSYNFFAGAPDPHIWIRFVPVLPRIVSDVVCRLKIGDRYRPYTYSHRGYRKLLRQAGFRDVEIFGVFPSYHNPREIISIREESPRFVGNTWVTRNRLSALAKGMMVKLDLLKYFSHNYIMFARN
jgi:SAM-dependent methyltransferase